MKQSSQQLTVDALDEYCSDGQSYIHKVIDPAVPNLANTTANQSYISLGGTGSSRAVNKSTHDKPKRKAEHHPDNRMKATPTDRIALETFLTDNPALCQWVLTECDLSEDFIFSTKTEMEICLERVRILLKSKRRKLDSIEDRIESEIRICRTLENHLGGDDTLSDDIKRVLGQISAVIENLV